MAKIRNFDQSSSSDEDFSKLRLTKLDFDLEEGELSSDIEDLSNLDKLFKNNEDRMRLFNMSEKEREVEIFKRTLELSDIKSRQKVVKKLNEIKEQSGFQQSGIKKRLLDNVLSLCSDDESLSSSSFDSNSLTIKKIKYCPKFNSRQKALENHKSSQNAILSQLNENRKLKMEKQEKLEKENKSNDHKKSFFEANPSDSEEKIFANVDRVSIISSPSPELIDERRRDVYKDKVVEEIDNLSKIRLSRTDMEAWVHMPFFKDLVKGCFVRVIIGEGPEVVQIYRIAEIIEVVETDKAYDLGKTRTNIGVKLRIGQSVTMFQLLFLSNQNFTADEFEYWRDRVISENYPLPKLSFVEEKHRQIKQYSNYSISNEETMKQVLLSKQRFQKGPVNSALRKAELTRLKLFAENDGDLLKASQYQEEIDDLTLKVEKLERKRTEGMKNISYINERNRAKTMEHVEKAIELERAEKLEWEKKGGDPLDREPTKPILNYKKRKQEQLEKEAQLLKQLQEVTEVSKSELEESSVLGSPKSSPKVDSENKVNIQNIHDFEVHLDLKLNGGNAVSKVLSAKVDRAVDMPESMLAAISNRIGYTNTPQDTPPNLTTGNRRVLNLQDYKRRKGLI